MLYLVVKMLYLEVYVYVVPGGVDAVPGGIDAGGVQAVALQPAIGTAVHSHTGHRWREILIPGNNKN